MNIRQIEVFKAIMDAGSVTEAAEQLHVSQPSVSKHLKLLEFALGLSLFQRTGNRLVPTPEARAFYDQIERVYSGLDHLTRFAEDLKQHRHGEILVAAMPLIAHRWLPRIIGRFLSAHENISVSLPVRSSRWINEWVAASRGDIGICLSTGDEAGLTREKLMDLPLVCVLPPGHRLHDRDSVEPGHLEGESLITLTNFDRWRLAVERALEDHRVQPRRRVDTFTTDVACELVRHGVGVAIVDALTALDYARTGLTVRRFEPTVPFEIFMLRPRHWPASEITNRFAAIIVGEAERTRDALMSELAEVGGA
jgi:DNA-binding transcriptional LysR family regulator